MNKKVSQSLLSFITQLPTIITIVFGAVIFTLYQIHPLSVPDLLSYLIALVSLTAISMLIERLVSMRRIERNVMETNQFLKLREGLPSLDDVLKTRQLLAPLEERFKYAKEIKIWGGSLSRLAAEYLDFFEDKAKEGCVFKFIVANPDANAADLLSKYIVYESTDPNVYKHSIETTIKSLQDFAARYADLVTIKTTKIMPCFGLFISDAGQAKATIMAELYALNTPTRKRYHLAILKNREPNAFRFYNDQFEEAWTHMDTISC